MLDKSPRGDTSVGDHVAGDKVGGDKIDGSKVEIHAPDGGVQVYLNTGAPPDLAALRQTYLAHLQRIYQHLDFKGIPQVQRVATLLRLEDVYVGLQARAEVPAGETWCRDDLRAASALYVAGRALAEADGEMDVAWAARATETAPRPVEQALADCPAVVLLGDPGSGKSTFLKYRTLQLAQAAQADPAKPLPILVPLAAYAAALAQRGDVALAAFLPAYYAARDIPGLAPLFAMALEQSAAVVLLDGLDEVLERRTYVAQQVEDLTMGQAGRDGQVVVTSRIVGYREAPLRSAGWRTLTLTDWGRAEIERFADQWCRAFELATHGDIPEAHAAAKVERAALLETIFSNPGVERLATNPLLLTILALIKRQGVTLPHRRAELYELYLKTLIQAWSRARSLDRRPVGPALDYLATVEVLGPLALWLREINPGAGLVSQTDLERWLTDYYMGDEWGLRRGEARQHAREFLAGVHKYSNLLLERGEGQYGFIHLTFEEYLAAKGLALRGQLDIQQTVDFLTAHAADPAWRETSLLTVGTLGLVQQQRQVASQVVAGLLKLMLDSDARGLNVVRAGEAVLDVGEVGVTAGCRQQVLAALVHTVQDRAVPPPTRRQAGLVLGWLGDPRPDVRCDVPAMIDIPAGTFLMGSTRETVERWKREGWSSPAEREQPQHEVSLLAYRIGKYPVTVAQYRRFVEAGGYTTQKHWMAASWAWREEEGLTAPRYWYDPRWMVPNHPVIAVSWYEAAAYCRWLSATTGRDFRLPTEAEWERAARGNDGREWPWGDEWESGRSNTEHIVGSTTAVGLFPGDESPYGLLDVAGNVLEWCSSRYQPYPFQVDDAVAEDQIDDRIGVVFRGGSWFSARRDARCAYRYGLHPTYWSNNVGFRVAE